MYRTYLVIAVLFLQIACSASAQQQTITKRKPMQKNNIVLRSPKDYSNRTLENGKEYDPKPRVVLIDKKAKKYELRWIGYDGKEKIVKYQGHDAIDIIVRAKAKKKKDIFFYSYSIESLATSSTFLGKFIVQNLASEVKPQVPEEMHVGRMGSYIPHFKEGNWVTYGTLSNKVSPGKSIKFSLFSPAPPGIVGCRARGGASSLKGAGEHMPSELERTMPGFEELPYGYTIGPVDSLAKMSKKDRAKYFLENLDKFQEAGWMTGITAKNYASILKRGDLAQALKKAEKDLANKFITTEIFSILEGLNS